MSFTWDVRIRFVDTDASGRIHYTAMFKYFEQAPPRLYMKAQPLPMKDAAMISVPRS